MAERNGFAHRTDGLVKLILPKGEINTLLKPHPKATEAHLQLMGFHFDLDDTGGYEIIEVNDLVIPLSNSHFPKTALVGISAKMASRSAFKLSPHFALK